MAYAYANISAASTGDTSRCLVWTGDLIDMEKTSFAENLYVRLGGSAGTRVLYTSSSLLSLPEVALVFSTWCDNVLSSALRPVCKILVGSIEIALK